MRLINCSICIVMVLSGCNRAPVQPVAQKTSTKNQTSDLDSAKDGLRRAHPDAEFLRSILDHINSGLAADPQKRPAPLNDSEKSFLKGRLGLSDVQIQQLNLPDFQLLDAHVLDQALVFRDIAQSLGTSNAKPVEAAIAGLDWVARHVRLEERNGPIDPPDRVVLRGRGTGIERIYVLVSLLQQLGLESYAIGDESAASDLQKLWGVGVIIGDQVIFLDPRLGIPLPGSQPNEPVKMADLKNDGKSLDELTGLGYDVNGARAKAAKLYFALPLGTLAPRFRAVEPLMSDGPLHLAVDVKKLMASAERFGISAWNATTVGTPTRVLAEFLPPEEGGADRAPAGPERRMSRYQIENIDWSPLPVDFARLPGPFGDQIRRAYVDIAWRTHQPGIAAHVRQEQRFVENVRALQTQEKAKELPSERLLDDIARSMMANRRGSEEQGPTLMEMLLRGQHNEAIETMVLMTDHINKLVKVNVSQTAAIEWAKKAQSAFVELIRAQRASDQSALLDLEGRFNSLANESKVAVNFVQQKAAGPLLARLSFLIALSKHDQADSRSRQSTSKDAVQSSWQSVADGWATYLLNYPQSVDALTAHRLRGVALSKAGDKNGAAESFRQAAGLAVLMPDRIACAWLAKNP